MTTEEWLSIGLEKGIIDSLDNVDELTFYDAYLMWFRMKMNIIRPQSLDRIEVTFNKYYKNSCMVSDYVSQMNTSYVSDFINTLLMSIGTVTDKELGRIYQIVNNVLIYVFDLKLGGARLIDWSFIKRCLPSKCVNTQLTKQYCIPAETIRLLIHSVVDLKIYPLKQSACLCLALNFYLGLRVGELASLAWSDIDYDKKVVKICKTETKYYKRDLDGNRISQTVYEVQEDVKTVYSVREIPLVPQAINLIHLIRLHHVNCGYESNYLAYDGIVDGVLVRSLDRTLKRLCVLLEIPTFNTHLIRKTFASLLHDKGVSTRIISDLLGHSEMSTTEHIYILSSNNRLEPIRHMMQDALIIK